MQSLRALVLQYFGFRIPEFLAPRMVVVAAIMAAVLLAVIVIRRKGRRTAVPFDYSQMKPGHGRRRLIQSAELLLPLLVGIVLLTACGPVTTGTPIEKRSMSNIQFCVDTSGSMTSLFGEGNRYDASMAAINEFVNYREGDAFGLTFFASEVVHWCPLTTDSSAFLCAVPFMRPESQRAIGGGTRIGLALRRCQEVLEQRPDGDRMIILVSDGYSADLRGGVAEEIGAELRDARVSLYCIHIGGGDVPEEILTLTAFTSGEAFGPGDQRALETVFQRIDSMQPARIEVVEAEKVDNFRPWCLAALGTLACWAVSLFGLRYTPW